MNMKRKNGSVMKMLPILLAMVVVAALSLMYVEYMADYDRREQVDQVAREYILRMETEGYLSTQAKNEMLKKLEEIGLTNINLQGTTFEQAEYGKEISLNISGSLIVTEYQFDDFLDVVESQKSWLVKVSKKTTAKC